MRVPPAASESACAEGQELNPARFLESGMKPWNPKTMWRRVRRSVRDWMEPEEAEPDPSLMFHLTFAMPLIIGVLIALRQL